MSDGHKPGFTIISKPERDNDTGNPIPWRHDPVVLASFGFSIERGLRAVLDEIATTSSSSEFWSIRTHIAADLDLPRLVEIFQKAAKE